MYSYKFKRKSPSKDSLFDAIHLSRCFFHCSEQFLNSSILMPFSAAAIFLFHLFYTDKTFPFEDFFIQGNKKVTWGEIWWIGKVRHGGHTILVKNYWTFSMVWTGVLINHPSWNGQTRWKSLQKNALKPNTASRNNTSWYTDTWVSRTLT